MIIDLLFLLVAGYGFYRGYNSGILRTVFVALSILVGLFIAMRYSVPFTHTLQNIFKVEHAFMFIAGFLLAFLIAMFFIRIIARLIERLLKNLNVNFINQIAGGVVFSAALILVYSVILWFLVESSVIPRQNIEESYTYPYLESYPQQSQELFKKIQPIIRDFWQESGEAMKKEG
jgi:membrane protein required for colicin V production